MAHLCTKKVKRIALLIALLSASLLTRSYLLQQTYAYVLTVLVYLVLISWILNLGKTEIMIARYPLYTILLIFAVYLLNVLLSVFEGRSIFTTALRSTVFVAFAAVNLFVLPNYYTRTEFIRTLSIFSAAIILIGLPTAVLGDYSIFGVTVLAWPWALPITPPFIPNGFLHPIKSVANNPNVVGLLAAIGTICSASELLRQRKLILSVILLFNISGVYLSGSRAALLSIAAGGTLLTLWYAGDIHIVRRVTVIGVVGWMIFIAVVSGLLPPHELVAPLDLRGRRVLWSSTVEAVSSRPLLGFGPGDRASFIRPFTVEDWQGHTPHNSYLRMYLTTGLVGGTSYVYFTLSSIFGAIQPEAPPDTITLGIVAVAASILQTFAGFSLFGLSFNSILIALVFGFAIHPSERLQEYSKMVAERSNNRSWI